MTPGTTPLGTRDMRTFFSGRVANPEPADAAKLTLGIAAVPGGAGGGVISNALMMDAGSASTAWRYPEVRKSRWVCAAFRFVSTSACSSESCNHEGEGR